MPERRILLVYPRFSPNNLLSFEYMTSFYPRKRAVMPPLGLLIIGQLLKEAGFAVRLVDENVRGLDERDLEWADVVATSGMHPQRARIEQIVQRANALGKIYGRVARTKSAPRVVRELEGTDDEESGARMSAFIRDTQAPIVYFNLLSALPKTPLWDRLTAEQRLVADEGGDVRSSESLLSCLHTNVRTRLPADVVKAMLLQTVREIYAPEEVYARFTWNAEHVYTRQLDGIPPARSAAERWYLVQSAVVPLAKCVWGIGIRAPYRRHFWRFAKRLVELRIEGRLSQALYYLLKVTPNAHHLIVWGATLEASAMEVNTSTSESAA